MHDHDAIATLIERIIARASIPSRAHRDDLRRELWTHFEEAGHAPDAARDAVRRFGAEALIGESLRDVYRRDYTVWYLAKIAASIVASIAVTLLIEVFVNLRVEVQTEVWRLAPGFSRAAGMSVAVGIGHLCSKLERWPPRVLALVGAFAAALYVNHALLSVAFGPSRALIAGAILGTVWSSTAAILNRVDHAFGSILER